LNKSIFALCLSLLIISNAWADNKEIQLGSVAMDTPIIMYNKLVPLADYLSKETGLNIVFKSSMNLDSTVSDLTSGAVMISYLTPISYVDAHNKNKNVVALVSPITNNSTKFTLVIATASTSPYKNIKELKGKTFAYGDPKALVQKAVIYDAGLTNEDFSQIAYLNHYDNIAKAILAGDFDGGILKDTVFDTFKTKGLKEIYRSEPIPGYVFAVNKALGAANIAKIESAFLKLNITTNDVLLSNFSKGCTGFEKIDNKSYDIIRKIVEPLRTK